MRKVLSQLDSFQVTEYDDVMFHYRADCFNPLRYVTLLRESNSSTISTDNESHMVDMLLSYSCGNSSHGESTEESRNLHNQYRETFIAKMPSA